MLRHSFELFAQFSVLRCNAHRASVEVALAHHDAPHGNERSGGKAELLSPQKRCHHHISARPEITICFQGDPTSKTVQDQGLVALRQAQLPAATRALDACPLGGTCPSVTSTDEDVIGFAFSNSCCNHANSCFTHKLHTHICLRVGILQVMDELCQILDGIDVVVRRRGNKADSWRAVATLRNMLPDLLAGELTSFTWLCPLCHLDLDLFGVCEVLDSDPKAARGHLFDC
mmetsp:Transcript_39606/g.71275  ORF Transcript_39606/g.71275 Transcript_39606/m.71275 type:complete len:230 (+) Transcript_39606:2887-3576(+)